MKQSDIFREAKTYIRRGWTQGTFARDADGRQVPQGDPTAVCWCLDGAVGLAQGREDGGADRELFGVMSDVLEGTVNKNYIGGVIDFNDSVLQSPDEVIAFLDLCQAHCLAYDC